MGFCVGGKPTKIINVYQPAGKMEEFFREIGKYKATRRFMKRCRWMNLNSFSKTSG